VVTVVVLADVRPNLGLRVVKLLVSACGVGDAVTEVELERQQRDGPVPRGTTYAIVRLIRPHVARVVVSNPQKTRAIAEAKIKTDKVDAAILAELLAADYLPSVWVADEATHALRRQVARRANIVRQRTRLKNQVQAILPAI
jgi:transposase